MISPKPKPTVVPASAAEAVRSLVFEHRDSSVIDQRVVVTETFAAGHGNTFPAEVRRKRMKTCVLQVLRRLRKYGWLGEPDAGVWRPTDALRNCSRSGDLARRVPRSRRAVSPPVVPPPPDSWEGFIQDWVFRHRRAEFGIDDVAADLVQRGYGAGVTSVRMRAAREAAEKELRSLRLQGLLRSDRRSGLWRPTVLLREWPAAEDA